jgi:hypothetical protein
MEHTPTPWTERGNNITDSANGLICTFEKGHWTFPNAKYNRHRIVECVNACDGIEDPARWFEDVSKKIDDITKDTIFVLSVKDKEIAALQDRVKKLEGELKDRLRYIDDTY